ncbi:MAG: hypothetical protein V3V81_07550 [Candidatus Bathyarchaeia archaeon]
MNDYVVGSINFNPNVSMLQEENKKLREALKKIQTTLPLHKYTTADTCQVIEDIVEQALQEIASE